MSGCKVEKPINKWNFVTAQLMNNVFIGDLVNPIPICSLSPDVPTSFSALVMTSCDVDISWVDPSGSSGFELQRSLSPTMDFVTIYSGGNTFFSDSNLPIATYYYRVRAIGSIPSAYTTNQTAVVDGLDKAESNFVTTLETSCDAELVWDFNSFDSDVEVWRNINGAGYSLLTTVAAGIGGYIDPGLPGGDIIYYQIKKEEWTCFSQESMIMTPFNFGNAILGNKTNDRIDIDSSINSVAMTDNWSVSVWVKFTDLRANEATNNPIFLYFINGTNYTYLQCNTGPDTAGNRGIQLSILSGSSMSPKMNVPDDKDIWHNIIVTYESISGLPNEVKMYYDGVLRETEAVHNNKQATFGTCYLGYNGASSYSLNVYDEFVHVKDHIITLEEAQMIYNSNMGGDITMILDPSDFLIHYDFNQGIAEGNNTGILPPEITDTTGNGYDGTMTGTWAKIGTSSNWVKGNNQ